MKLRIPRTEIPPSRWGKDMLKLMHPMMFAPILMLVVIGTFLAPQLDLIRFILELIGVSCVVIAAYHIDEAWEKVTAPNVPKQHNIIIALASLLAGLCIGFYLTITVGHLLWIPIIIALLGISLYNLDVKPFSGRLYYSIVWGGTPIFGSYMLQTGEWPNLTVLVFTIFGMLLSVKLFFNWGLRTCGRASVCPKVIWNDPELTIEQNQIISECYAHQICHSPNTMDCISRQQIPKHVNDTMKILQKLDLLILFALMLGVIFI